MGKITKGDNFGDLEALDEGRVIGTHRYVTCRCVCGEVREYRADGLLNGTTKSCGCKKSPKTEQLIGNKYGKLTIIGKATDSSKKSVLCRCDCGNVVTKLQSLVLNGTRTTCGKCDYKQVSIGDVYGKWVVIGKSRKSANGYHKEWLCECTCEKRTKKYVDEQNLKRGLSTNCGCESAKLASLRWKTHGDSNSRLYYIWGGIKERCFNQNYNRYEDYGGRGIKLCDEWQSFVAFKEWALSNGYKENLTIDRIDVNGNYEPTNCRWITIQEQQNNKRNSVNIMYKGKVRTASEWGRLFNIKGSEIRRLYKMGLTLEEILIKKGVVAL